MASVRAQVNPYALLSALKLEEQHVSGDQSRHLAVKGNGKAIAHERAARLREELPPLVVARLQAEPHRSRLPTDNCAIICERKVESET